MTALLPEDVSERILAASPLPIADAFGALVGAESAFEQRDRVVEVFRATLRTLSAFTLAARLQFGPGPGAEPAQIPELIRSLRSRGLTDGQWFAIVREVLRPWAQAPGSHPLPALVTAIHGKKAEVPKLVDELLVMRKSETVAHGASGTKAAILEILERRVPQLLKLLSLLEPVFASARLVVPLATPEDEGEAQSAWSLTGYTPPRGRWRRCSLAAGVRLAPGEAALIDQEHKPIVALHPIVLVRRPSPEAVEELFTLDGGSKKGAVFVALPSMAEHRESDAWGALAKALEGGESEADNAPPGGADRPFRGLSSFGPEHASLFFGREEQAESLANRIRRHALVTVTGPSGSGKTSLLRAGALSQLRDCHVVVLRPGAAPVESLAHRLAEALGDGHSEGEIAGWVREDPALIADAISAWARRDPGDASAKEVVSGADKQATSPAGKQASSSGEQPRSASTKEAVTAGAKQATSESAASPYRAGPDGRRLVIVVDQAEELFTLSADEEKRELFGRALARLGASPDSASRVVLSVREDFFGRLATIPSLRGLYSRTVEVVTTPDREALARTLYLPAKHFGYAFEDEALVWAMVDAVASEPAALALLQFCADRLWEVRDRTWKRLSWEAYRALGGVEGALAAHADRTLAEMSGTAERTARNLMLRLVTAERTRSTATRTELLESAADRDAASVVLDRLISARLLTVREADDGKDAHVEIVHEALIRHWGKLSSWLAEDVEGQRLLHAMRQAAREWDSRGRARGLLWSGEALSDLRRWRRRSTEKLAATEAAFLQASEAEEARGRRLRRGLSAAAFVATGAFGAFMFWQWRAAESARAETEKAQVRAEVRGLVSEAHNLYPTGKHGKALALLRAASSLETPDVAGAPTEVSLEMERLQRSGAASIVLDRHEAQVRSMAVCAGHPWLVTGAFDGMSRVWDTTTGALLHTLGKGGEKVWGVACSPDGKTIAAASTTLSGAFGSVRLWDAQTGEPKKTLDFQTGAARVLFSPDQDMLAVVLDEGGVATFRADGSEPRKPFGGREEGAEDAVFSADGKWLATLQATNVRVYSTADRRLLATIPNSSGQVMAIAFAPDGTLGVPMGGAVRLFDPETGKEKGALTLPDPGTHDNGKIRAIACIAFSPDGKLAAGGGMDNAVRVWDLATGQIKHQLYVHGNEIKGVAFSPDSARLVSASMDGTAGVWDMASGALVARLTGHEAELHGARFLDGSRVATISYDRTARVWDTSNGLFSGALTTIPRGLSFGATSRDSRRLAVAGGEEARVIDTNSGAIVRLSQEGQISGVAISGGGARVATGTLQGAKDGVLRVFDAVTGQLRATIAGHERGVSALAFSPDERWVASGTPDGRVRVWSADSGDRVSEMPSHPAGVTEVAFSGDGALLVSGASNGSVQIADAKTGVLTKTLQGGQGPVTDMLFAPGGRMVLVAQDTEVRMWDVASGELRATLGGYEQAVMAMAFSPDGKTLAATASDGVTRLWAYPEGRLIREVRTTGDGGFDVAFSPDGQRLFVASGEGQSYAWDVATGVLLARLYGATNEPGLPIARAIPLGDEAVLSVAEDGSLLRFSMGPVGRERAFLEAGKRGNERVCRRDFRVVSVSPLPDPKSVWAPDSLCGDKAADGQTAH
ncbi:MAG: AAA family ATPase [Polyangiaceae bacterium]